MSAVAGIVHLDGGQASPVDLDCLVRSMRHWGNDALSHSTTNSLVAAIGSSSVRPDTCLNGEAVVTVAARLDNREALSNALGLSATPRSVFSDECLVVQAFERWGEACVDRILGDWSMAVWRPRSRQLFLARDHFGNTGLYYARCGERVAFASDMIALQSIPWVPRRLDEARIASLLVGGGVDDAALTVCRDISRVPPAHAVTVTARDERRVRFWRIEDTPDSGPASIPDRVAMLRETLRVAVRSRLSGDGAVGSMLSGGLDSGAVTALAAEPLREAGRRLTAFTAVPAHPAAAPQYSGDTDEGPAAAEIVRSFDCIDHVLIDASAVTPIAGIRRGLAIHGEPLIAAANYAWITELMANARARGITQLFTGQVGDFVMGGRPAVRGWRQDWSAGHYRSVLKRAAPAWLVRLRRVGWKPWQLAGVPWQTFSVINPSFAGELQLAERMNDAGRDPRAVRGHSQTAAVRRQATSQVGAIAASLGAAFGLTIVDPLEDKRVMELMFSAPRPPSATTDRWLFRQSMIGVLPEHVVRSRRKGMQSADIVERLLASWNEVEDALNAADASPLARRCIDLRYCRVLAASIRSGAAGSERRRRSFMLANGLSAALFLAENWEGA